VLVVSLTITISSYPRIKRSGALQMLLSFLPMMVPANGSPVQLWGKERIASIYTGKQVMPAIASDE